MSFQATVFKVMIASPGDVPTERQTATEELYRWNDANAVARRMMLQPVKWETHSSPQMGAHPQTIINQDLLIDADIVVGIFGTRIGTPTEEHISGTVEEIKKHVAAGKLAMLYFSDVPVAPSTVDSAQYQALQAFKDECKTLGLYAEFETHEGFRNTFSHHLDIELNKPRYIWQVQTVQQQNAQPVPLSDDAKRLLISASKDRNGSILTTTTMDGFWVQSNYENFADASPRSAAHWKKVLKQLTERGLLEANGKDTYDLTDDGFAEAELAAKAAAEEKLRLAISTEALHLLQAAGEEGQITVLRAGDHDLIEAGRRPLPDSGTPRQIAVWNAALNELVDRGFVEQKSDALFQVTHSGYEYADSVQVASEPSLSPAIDSRIS